MVTTRSTYVNNSYSRTVLNLPVLKDWTRSEQDLIPTGPAVEDGESSSGELATLDEEVIHQTAAVNLAAPTTDHAIAMHPAPAALPPSPLNPGAQSSTASPATAPIQNKDQATIGRIADWMRRYFVRPGEMAELRIIYPDGEAETGYFDHDHLDQMAGLAYDRSISSKHKGAYFVLNPLDPTLFARSPNRLTPGIGATRDTNILRRRWFFIDVDPRRPKGMSAMDAEKARARAKVIAVRKYLRELGWPEPLLCDSGNGYHLLYPIDLPVNDGGLVRRVLRAIAAKFDDEGVEIDTLVYNPSRIDKLYGSKACKGPDTPERPHRWTAIIEEPTELKIVPCELLETLAGSAKPTGKKKAVPTGATAQAPVLRAERRARAYLAAMDPAVQGQGGDKQTYRAACALIHLFGLSVEGALPLLREWNETHCDPPWDEAGLRHKLERARLDPRPGQSPLEERRAEATPPKGRRQEPDPGVMATRFCGVVRDLGMVDAELAELFNAIGRVPRLFADLLSWHLLSKSGTSQSASETGPGTLATAVRTAASQTGGFVFRMAKGVDWAIRLLPTASPNHFHAMAFCRQGAGWLLAPALRPRRRDAVDERGIHPDGTSPGEGRSRLATLVRKLRLKRIEELMWFLVAKVLDQRSTRVVVPNVAVAQIVWGPDRQDWPRRWRRHVFDLLSSLTLLRRIRVTLNGDQVEIEPATRDETLLIRSVEEPATGTKAAGCSRACPLYENRTGHRHLVVRIGPGLLGGLMRFCVDKDQDGEEVFDFKPDLHERLEKARCRAKKLYDVGHGKLRQLTKQEEEKATAAYKALFKDIVTVPMALQIFGNQICLSPHQRRCLRVLVREVTRSPRGRGRARGDRAEVFAGNRVPGRRRSNLVTCNLLKPETDHIAFNGNGRCWGTGYRIWTWMQRMGYRIPKDREGQIREVKRFLRNIGRLCALVDVAPAGFLDGEWYSPEQMREMNRTGQGRRRLNRLRLRFYTRADYLQRWRGLLAPALGADDGAAGRSDGKQLQESDLWSRMEQLGMRQKDLAARLGKTPGFISRLRRGKKKWPPVLYQKALEIIGAQVAQPPGP